jgi:pentose-5-phosphate-3-epimerase
MPEAVQAAGTLARTSDRYGYRLIFDGGVNSTTVHSIPASMIVSSSSVLRAENPFTAIIQLIGDRVSPHG